MATLPETAASVWSTRLASELNASDHAAQTLAAHLTNAQLNWQPAPSSWSIGQCLEHLCILNEKYLKAISEAIKDKSDSPVAEITPGVVERWFIRKFVEPSPQSKRVPAPPKTVPSSIVDATVLDRFLSSNQLCRNLIVQNRDKDINRIRFWNPLAPGIRFRVGTGLQIISSHERRHLLQAQRVRDSATFPR